ncbi:hypothetical protein E2C01_042478 [Portunus trituberculatus]|uniref:Uncharacterized protein n=1 Tax=Portunus trituberculatus TaxID=210409 RepID=A0A5B7FWL5_PORTR|nr:hypothetical protein [Portunus trituberculatus]
MTGQKTMITLRIQVTIPYGNKRPHRVRVVAKDRGALVFPYRRKLASVPLYKAGWKRVPGEGTGWLWQNEQAAAVPVDMAKLLRYKNLALQLYCLRGDDVKHKGVFNFRRVMEQQHHQDELLLAMRYSTGWWWRWLAVTCFGRGEDEAAALRGGALQRRLEAGEGQPPGKQHAGDGPAAAELVARRPSHATDGPAATQLVAEWPSGAGDGPAGAQHAARRPSHATDGPTATQLAAEWPSVDGDGPAEAQHVACDTGMVDKIREFPSSRPLRFPDSGAVFPELLREYDLKVADEKEKQDTQKEKEKTPRTQCDVRKEEWQARSTLRALWMTNRAVHNVWRAGKAVQALRKRSGASHALWTAGSGLHGLWMTGSTVDALVAAGSAVHALWTGAGASWRMGGTMSALLTGRRAVRAIWTVRRAVRALWLGRRTVCSYWTVGGVARAMWTAGRAWRAFWSARASLQAFWRAEGAARALWTAGGATSLALVAGSLLSGEDTQPLDWLLWGLTAAVLLRDFCIQVCAWLRRRRDRTGRNIPHGDNP